MIADLNSFKQVNDSYGHRAGDLVLVTVAAVLREAIRDSDIVARIGGDEFALLLADAEEEEDARAVAALIAEVLRAQRFTFDPDASVSASMGVAAFVPWETTSTALLAEASRAMYRAKGIRPSRRSGPPPATDPGARRTAPR